MRCSGMSYRCCVVLVVAFTSVSSLVAAPPAGRKLNITISRETTYLDGPVRPDGTIDYVAALRARLSAGVTKENNAAVLLMRAFGPWFVPAESLDEAKTMLGIASLSEEGGDYYMSVDECALENATEAEKEPVFVGPDEWEKDDIQRRLEAGEISREEAQKQLNKKYPGLSRIEERALDEMDEALAGPWDAADLPLAAAWLKANERPMALIAEASRRPRYCLHLWPAPADACAMYILLPDLALCRDAGRTFCARAMLRLQEGDIDGALADLTTLHRFGRLIAGGGTLVEHLMGLAMDALACKGDWALIASGRLSLDQCRDFQARLQCLPPTPSVRVLIDFGERCSYLSAVTVAARHGLSSVADLLEIDETVVAPLDTCDLDWNYILRRVNAHYDETVRVYEVSDAAKRRRAVDKSTQTLQQRLAFLQTLTNATAVEKIAAAARCGDAAARRRATETATGFILRGAAILMRYRDYVEDAAMRAELSQLALAIETGRLVHGRYPKGLTSLVGRYVRALPKDRFSGKALIYRREGDGYVLYSVGKNLRDDGGRDEDDGDDYDDIVLRIARPAEFR